MSDTEQPEGAPDETGLGSDALDEIDQVDGDMAALLADPTMWENPSSDVGDRIIDAVRSESSLHDAVPVASTSDGRRAWLRPALLGAAAAIVFLFGGIVVLSALSGVEDRETFSSELISTGLLANVSGDVDIAVFDSGLRIDLDAPTLPRRDNGAYYEGWLQTFDGDLVPVGTFHEGDGVVLWAGVGLDQVESFTITLEESAAGQDLGQGSSGDVVLRTTVGG